MTEQNQNATVNVQPISYISPYTVNDCGCGGGQRQQPFGQGGPGWQQPWWNPHHQPWWAPHQQPWWGPHHQPWWAPHPQPWWNPHHQPWWGNPGWGQQWGGKPGGPGWKREDE